MLASVVFIHCSSSWLVDRIAVVDCHSLSLIEPTSTSIYIVYIHIYIPYIFIYILYIYLQQLWVFAVCSISSSYHEIKSVLVVLPPLRSDAKPLFTLEPASGIRQVTAGHLLTCCHRAKIKGLFFFSFFFLTRTFLQWVHVRSYFTTLTVRRQMIRDSSVPRGAAATSLWKWVCLVKIFRVEAEGVAVLC